MDNRGESKGKSTKAVYKKEGKSDRGTSKNFRDSGKN